MKNIQMNYSGLLIDVNLMNRLTILLGDSGSGKTFLFSALTSYFILNGINYGFLDYNISKDNALDIVKLYKDAEFILLDNADLYMTKELWQYISNAKSYFIIELKGWSNIIVKDMAICNVKYTSTMLTLESLI